MCDEYIAVLEQVKIPESNDIFHNSTNQTTANFTGFSLSTFHENLQSNYGKDYTAANPDEIVTFAVVFGVLFSGVTGTVTLPSFTLGFI